VGHGARAKEDVGEGEEQRVVKERRGSARKPRDDQMVMICLVDKMPCNT
jgi:hypothetical protein